MSLKTCFSLRAPWPPPSPLTQTLAMLRSPCVTCDILYAPTSHLSASHLFDTLQTVIGLLYVSVHRRNRVHVDCPSSASTCQPLNWSVLQQKQRHKLQLASSHQAANPITARILQLSVCVRRRACVCVALWAEQGDIDLAGDEHLGEPRGWHSSQLLWHPLTSPGGCPECCHTPSDRTQWMA